MIIPVVVKYYISRLTSLSILLLLYSNCCTYSSEENVSVITQDTVVHVPDPGEGVCSDPVNGGAILGKGGPDPQGGNKERQLSPDKGREKT
jgi:hypothetical protein